MIGPAAEIFLRQLPPDLAAGVRLGTHVVNGSIVRELSSGRIAGLLQETSATGGLLGGGPFDLAGGVVRRAAGATPVGAVLNQVVGSAQHGQVIAALEAARALQVAGVLVSAAGIGVTIAGTLYLAQRIGAVQRSVEAVEVKLDALAREVEGLRRDRLADDVDLLAALSCQSKEAWEMRGPGPQLQKVATDAHEVAMRFERRACEVLDRDPDAIGIVLPLARCLAVASSLRVSARLASGDDRVALAAAEDGAARLAGIGERLDPVGATLRRLALTDVQAGTQPWGGSFEAAAGELLALVAEARAMTVGAASSAVTIVELGRQGIDGRAWLERARAETSAPLIFLEGAG